MMFVKSTPSIQKQYSAVLIRCISNNLFSTFCIGQYLFFRNSEFKSLKITIRGLLKNMLR